MVVPVIAIDGPGGSGKGTISRLVAKRLGWHMLDSGALYRLVGLAAQRKGVDFSDEKALAALAEGLEVQFLTDGSSTQILLEGDDVTYVIRTEEAGKGASLVAAVPAVRTALFKRQRAFCQAPGLVADGRDMGTVVFKDAPLKIYLTASAEERASRRYKQLKEQGFSANLPALLEEIVARDERDMNRAVAPLKPAEDAIVLDSTTLTIDEVVERVMHEAQQRALVH